MFCESGYQYFQNKLGSSPYNYLEIGVFDGDSVANIAKTHYSKIAYGIDPFIEDGCTTYYTGVAENEPITKQKETTYRNISGLDNVVLFEMLSSEFSEILTDEMVADMNVAWVLIDGGHHYKDVKNDYELAMRLIGDKKGGIVFDDCNLDGVSQAYSEFCSIYSDRISNTQDLLEKWPGHVMAHLIN